MKIPAKILLVSATGQANLLDMPFIGGFQWGRTMFCAAGLFAFTVIAATATAQPVVSNVRVAQRAGTGLVDIYYDLASAGNAASVSVIISTNGGAAFNAPAVSLTGDLGSSITPGTGKHVVWNAGADLTALYFPNVKVRVQVPATGAFSDNFDGGVIDTNKWMTSGNTVLESGGTMQVLTTITDQGGVLNSVPIPINQHEDITITRSVFVHYANQYFAARFNMKFGNLGWNGIYYANYIWPGNPSYGWEDRYGIYLLRNDAYIINQSADTDLAGPFTPIWDTWFTEKLIYSPDTGILQYFINNSKVADFNIGVMPPTNNPTLQFQFTAWGWWTGHEQLFDNLLVTQNGSNMGGTADSPVFAVDFRNLTGGLAVKGRVLDGSSRQPLTGVSVSVAGQNTTTLVDGSYSFANVSQASGSTLNASLTGYLTASLAVTPPPGASLVTLPDVLLQTIPAANQPAVTAFNPARQPVYISGLPITDDFTASVNWNGSTPGTVEFYANGKLVKSLTGAGPTYTVTLDSTVFNSSLAVGGNTLSVLARNSQGTTSTANSVTVYDVPYPQPLAAVFPANGFSLGSLTISADADWPTPPISTPTLSLPVIGTFGMDFKLNPHFQYDFGSSEWELGLGNVSEQQHSGVDSSQNVDLYLGPNTVKGTVRFGGQGTFSPVTGFTASQVYVGLQLSDKFPLGEPFGLLDLLGPGISGVVSGVPVVGNLVKAVSIQCYAEPEIGGDLNLSFPGFQFQSATFGGSIALTAEYEPALGQVGKLRAYVGGTPSVTFQLPSQPPGGLLQSAEFDAYAGIELQTWVYSFSGEYVFLKYAYPSASPNLTMQPLVAGRWMQVSGSSPDVAQIVARPNLRDRSEQFVACDNQFKANLTQAGLISGLDAFRAMGQKPTKVSPMGLSGNSPQPQGSGISGSSLAQADLTLVNNAFPNNDPAMDAFGQELMLLYVVDNGSTNNVNFTDIKWTCFDGTNWSAPLTIQTNTQAEFEPQVKYDGNGNAIAVWDRVNDPNFNQTNLTAMSADMEIVWSQWNRTNGTWSTPVALAANNYLDHASLLCGPMADGSLLLTWTANTSNLMIGTNGAGSQVLWSSWNPASQTWSPAQLLITNLPYRLSQSLSGVSNLAVYAWSQDTVGTLTNLADDQVFYCLWTNGVWSAASAFTTNALGNRNARVVVSPNAASSTVEGFESGNFSAQPWTFTGNAPWTVQSGTVHSGSYAAASGTITDSQTSGMVLSKNCVDGAISFAYSVSSEPNYDYLRFYIDGVQQGAWSGTVAWTTASYPVTAGFHTFEWRYTKDVSVSVGSDKAWVDDIVLPVSPLQQVSFVWQQGNNLVMSTDYSASQMLVRPNSETAGFSDFAMTFGPANNLLLLWQDMTTNGCHAHYTVYDPVSATWSQDELLRNDPPLERSFAPVWDNAGNLTVAYDVVNIFTTNITATLTDGSSVTITNVPQPGQVDIAVTKRALIRDLALLPGDFTASGNNFLSDDTVTLTANVRNLGDLGLSNIVVDFYDGDPNSGGILISNVTVAGWLPGAATNGQATALWTVPTTATNHVLYAVVNQSGAANEFNPTNNTQSVSVGGTDLAVSFVSYIALTNGSVRVIAQVQNLGAPAATNSTLAIRLDGQRGTPLASVAIPALDPGQLAQVALDLPAGTQPGGEQVYRLTADDGQVVADVNTNNNTTVFSVFLWVDSDGDGIPDSWTMQYFGHPTGLAGDNSRAQDSASGDGINNLQKYLACMNPLVWDNLHFSGYASQPDGQFQLGIFGQTGTNYTLLASTDLVNWIPILNFTCINTPMNVVDPGAKYYGWRFYRIAQGTLPVMLKLGLNAPSAFSTNGLGFNFQAPLGFSYVIQASTDLVNWQPFTNFIGTNAIMFFQDTSATGFSRRFYRAKPQ
jgi:hypothetical protein